MGLTSTLNGNTVTTARVTRHDWGLWYADVALDKPVALSGAVELVVSDLKLRGTIVAGGAFRDRAAYKIVAGGGGWGKNIKRRSYANDAGVKVSQIIADAAQECGETVADITNDKPDASFVREAEIASRVLQRLSPSNWYVDELGITRLGKRARTTLNAVVAVQSVDRAAGVVSVASDAIAALAPGVTVEGIEALDVEHRIDDKMIRTTLWGKQGATLSRRASLLQTILGQLDPGRKFRGMYDYRVIQHTGDRLDLQAVRVSSGMPDLQRVPVRPGVPGCTAEFTPGSRVVVAFTDESASGAFVIAGDEVGSAGFLPLNLSIDATLLVKLGAGIKPIGAAGDPGNPAIVASQFKVLV
jgi:hypothetical protein